LPELALAEGNQQVAMKPEESFSSFFIHPSLAFLPPFTGINITNL